MGNQHSGAQALTYRKRRYQGECQESSKNLDCLAELFLWKDFEVSFYSTTFLVHDDHFVEQLIEESTEPSLLFQEGNFTQ